MSQEVLKTLYHAHIYQLLTYCNSIWYATYQTYLIPLKLHLKNIIRIITNSSLLEHTNPLLKVTKMLKLDDIAKLAVATYMYSNNNKIQTLFPSHDHTT
ncbi:hypothetical protein E2C01_032379 [Portunus trituberculatus]|uniref:Uncharacterized protein n=1 Tax=Portunus trituberculatus TaxID=210409 RepID=A0A5B7F173_PORTR|nr:hypothetical protein [Portunus trituberculatus]